LASLAASPSFAASGFSSVLAVSAALGGGGGAALFTGIFYSSYHSCIS